MNNLITLEGKIKFDPKDKTNKHKFQSAWKRMALVMLDGDVSEYYAWFVKKRYNIVLNPPLRGAHISFINDHIRDINGGVGGDIEKSYLWKKLKEKHHDTTVKITLSTDVRTDGKHWWLVIPEEERKVLHDIRSQVGLGRPHYGLHMSLGYANEKNIQHSEYIHRLLTKNLCD
jgi:hypothetical protein